MPLPVEIGQYKAGGRVRSPRKLHGVILDPLCAGILSLDLPALPFAFFPKHSSQPILAWAAKLTGPQRLCRGGSNSLTFSEVDLRNSES